MMNIKKYANRKLYDTQVKHYVTLLDVADAVRRGEEVQVTDYVSGADVTAKTLALAIVARHEAGGDGRVEAPALVRAIREATSPST